MRHIAVVSCALLAVGFIAHLHAQQPAPAFKGGVSLVTVDVTVLDKEGKPVPGLTAADFQVKLNGKVQPIRALSYLEARTDASESGPDPKAPVLPQMFPVAPVAASASATASEPRVFVVLVDDLSFAPLGGKALFSAAQRFVAGLPAADLVGFATSSGPGAVNPTQDRAPIASALKAVVGEYFDPRSIDRGGPGGGTNQNGPPDQSIGISQALDIERGDVSALKEAIARECFNGNAQIFNTQSVEAILASSQCASDIRIQARRTAALTKQTTDRQVAAFQSVIKAMKPATGIKHLLLLTEGLGITFDSSSLEPVARAAAEAGIQLSVIVEEPGMSLSDPGRRDPGTGPGTMTQPDTGMAQRRREDNAMFVNGAHTMADMVGGAFYRVIGDPAPFFRRVVVASSAVYRLAVDPPADAKPGRDVSLVATVRKSGLTTLTNKRAMVTAPADASAGVSIAPPPAAPPKAAAPIEEQLRGAMNAGRALAGVPIRLASALRRASDPTQVEIGIRVQIPATAKGPLTAVFGVVDGAGKLRSGRRTIDAPAEGEDYQLVFSVPVTPGAYQLRFAVADASGRVGAVSTPVRAELAAMGPFAASDLQMSWIDGAEQEQSQFPGLEDLPSTAKALIASLDLYAAAEAAPRDVLVKLAFGPAGQAASIERIVVPVSENGIFRAEAQFPLDRATPGAYIVQATVLVDGKVVGTASAAVRRR
jgi:VWFA-related protein